MEIQTRRVLCLLVLALFALGAAQSKCQCGSKLLEFLKNGGAAAIDKQDDASGSIAIKRERRAACISRDRKDDLLKKYTKMVQDLAKETKKGNSLQHKINILNREIAKVAKKDDTQSKNKAKKLNQDIKKVEIELGKIKKMEGDLAKAKQELEKVRKICVKPSNRRKRAACISRKRKDDLLKKYIQMVQDLAKEAKKGNSLQQKMNILNREIAKVAKKEDTQSKNKAKKLNQDKKKVEIELGKIKKMEGDLAKAKQELEKVRKMCVKPSNRRKRAACISRKRKDDLLKKYTKMVQDLAKETKKGNSLQQKINILNREIAKVAKKEDTQSKNKAKKLNQDKKKVQIELGKIEKMEGDLTKAKQELEKVRKMCVKPN